MPSAYQIHLCLCVREWVRNSGISFQRIKRSKENSSQRTFKSWEAWEKSLRLNVLSGTFWKWSPLRLTFFISKASNKLVDLSSKASPVIFFSVSFFCIFFWLYNYSSGSVVQYSMQENNNRQVNICWKCLSSFKKKTWLFASLCYLSIFFIFIWVDPRFQQTLYSFLTPSSSSDPVDHQPVPVARQLHCNDPPSRVLKVIKQCP